MSDFFGVMAFYYACDQAAINGRLAAADIARCAEAYETVKIRFLSDEERAEFGLANGPRRAALDRSAYRRFKSWEEDHPGLIRALRNGERLSLL
ncbi:hypothetical protein DEA8626_00574 [Defluviimonas aquaemixtae]|uniref:Uncharacterized protein n=1 Tax=Albidovulum aquaemixtae TaxID=1542388 RepID=A0A2R8B3F7_9RHOB|nr:hypothetical protein [Defluviimonas aquaemixtae]SPH17060.1 hypothetical protein DEA8626_00574 [Defluviimonas aquaemixtae]